MVKILSSADKIRAAVIKAEKVWKKYKITNKASKKKVAEVKANRQKALIVALGGVLETVLGADDLINACS